MSDRHFLLHHLHQKTRASHLSFTDFEVYYMTMSKANKLPQTLEIASTMDVSVHSNTPLTPIPLNLEVMLGAGQYSDSVLNTLDKMVDKRELVQKIFAFVWESAAHLRTEGKDEELTAEVIRAQLAQLCSVPDNTNFNAEQYFKLAEFGLGANALRMALGYYSPTPNDPFTRKAHISSMRGRILAYDNNTTLVLGENVAARMHEHIAECVHCRDNYEFYLERKAAGIPY